VDAGTVCKQKRFLLAVDYGDQAAVARGIACDAAMEAVPALPVRPR
jgi:hypothetical protein